jgi:glycosyltransferase involved in cell wall biosynthesis
MNHLHAETMHPDIPLVLEPSIQRRRITAQQPMVVRSLVGLPSLPTIVAIGPFDDRAHAEQLAAAFTTVRLRCNAQLVLVGTGVQRATIMRRTFALGVGTSVHAVRNSSGQHWSDLIAAADLVVPSTTTAPTTVLDVLAAGRPVVAPANPATVRLVVPSSAGLVYRPGTGSGMAAALLRLLTTPALRNGMASRAREVARRHHLEHITMNESDEGNQHE